MAGRSRHGLHVVRDGDAPSAEEFTPILPNAAGHPFLSLDQQSVVLAIAGRLNADTAGRLGMFLAMSSVVGGPRELVLDLSDVVAVDEDGMAPIFEADEAMCGRNASLRLASVSAAVSSSSKTLGSTGRSPQVRSRNKTAGQLAPAGRT